jgi:hypothetical protein
MTYWYHGHWTFCGLRFAQACTIPAREFGAAEGAHACHHRALSLCSTSVPHGLCGRTRWWQSGYGEDILTLPVKCIDEGSAWHGEKFGLIEVERRELPQPMILMERDGVRIGFAVNEIDPSNEGAVILVSDIARAKVELLNNDYRCVVQPNTFQESFVNWVGHTPLATLCSGHFRFFGAEEIVGA